jgi:hypothetical protein
VVPGLIAVVAVVVDILVFQSCFLNKLRSVMCCSDRNDPTRRSRKNDPEDPKIEMGRNNGRNNESTDQPEDREAKPNQLPRKNESTDQNKAHNGEPNPLPTKNGPSELDGLKDEANQLPGTNGSEDHSEKHVLGKPKPHPTM